MAINPLQLRLQPDQARTLSDALALAAEHLPRGSKRDKCLEMLAHLSYRSLRLWGELPAPENTADAEPESQ